MTLVVAWIGVDNRAVASLNFVSDSRMSWGDGETWDQGRKLFASRASPDIMAYCGDAFPATQILSQLLGRMDSGSLWGVTDNTELRVETVGSFIARSLGTYPVKHRGPFQVLFGTRVGSGVGAGFHVYELDFGLGPHRIATHTLPSLSGVVGVLGTGRDRFSDDLARWMKGDAGGTSRAVFSAACDTILDGGVPTVGGVPQLVSLQRKGNGLTFGIEVNGVGFVDGAEMTPAAAKQVYKWRNRLFEVLRPETLLRSADAQPQPRPSNVPDPS